MAREPKEDISKNLDVDNLQEQQNLRSDQSSSLNAAPKITSGVVPRAGRAGQQTVRGSLVTHAMSPSSQFSHSPTVHLSQRTGGTNGFGATKIFALGAANLDAVSTANLQHSNSQTSTTTAQNDLIHKVDKTDGVIPTTHTDINHNFINHINSNSTSSSATSSPIVFSKSDYHNAVVQISDGKNIINNHAAPIVNTANEVPVNAEHTIAKAESTRATTAVPTISENQENPLVTEVNQNSGQNAGDSTSVPTDSHTSPPPVDVSTPVDVNPGAHNVLQLVDSDSAANSIAENSAIGTVVGITAHATGADTAITYSLTDNAGGLFAIDPNSGIVTVAGPIDYESAHSHTITVQEVDVDGLKVTQNFAIGVTNANEAPTGLVDNNTSANTIARNAAIGTSVGITAHANDVDAGDHLSYSLTDNANGQFAIDGNTGVVTVAGALDNAANHNIIVRATDAAGLSTSQTFSINVVANAIHVSTAAELTAALNNAHGGETILLKAGVNFGNFSLQSPTHVFDSNVTIKSEDINNQATFNCITLIGVSNLTVDSVHINMPKDTTALSGFFVSQSSNITLSHSDVNGNLLLGVKGQHAVNGANVYTSTNVTLDGNNFHNLAGGTFIETSTNTAVINNNYNNNLGDNSDYGRDLTKVLIANNTFNAPDPTNPYNIHIDNIQFWTSSGSGNATKDTTDVTIRDNFIVDNTETHTQSIFGGSPAQNSDGTANPYLIRGMTIENNVIATVHTNAISFAGVDDLLIKNNTLVYNGTDTHPAGGNIPGIIFQNSTNVTVENNIVPDGGYNYTQNPTFMAGNNTIYQIGDDSLTNLLQNPNAPTLTMQDLSTLVKNADGSYNGALAVAPDANGPTAVIEQNYNIVQGHYAYTFDATLSLAQIGSNLDGATYQWQFADGTTAQGVTVSKTFAHAGEQDVILKVTDAQGHSNTLIKEMPIRDAVALQMNFDGNMNDSSANPSTVTGVTNPVYVDTPYGGKALQLGSGAGDNLNLTAANTHDMDFSNLQQLTLGFSMSANSVDNAALLYTPTQMYLVQNAGNLQVGNWGLFVDSKTDKVDFLLDGTHHNVTTSGVNIVDGHWHDIAFTVDQNNFIFYLDGAKTYQLSITSSQAAELLNPGVYGTTIGGTPWANHFKGDVDNLYVGSTALTDQQIADMHLANVNTAPTNLTDSNNAANSVAENSAVGTVVGITAHATDANTAIGDALTYSLSDNAGGLFAIDPNSGIVTVAGAIDYEAAKSQSITVVATDKGGLSTSQNFTVAVTNVNEAPTNLVDNNVSANNVFEHVAVGTAVGITAHATDVDAGDKVSYSLSDNAGGEFAINANTGVVTVAGALVNGSHNITVVATDKGGLSTGQTFAINVDNTIHVSTAAELTSALSTATGGETILLAAGVDFGALNTYGLNKNYSSTVTVKSEDSGHPAVFDSVTVTGMSHLTFDSIKIQAPSDASARTTFTAATSSYITLQNSDVAGNSTPGILKPNGVNAVDIHSSDNITLDNNVFHNAFVGTGISTSSNIAVTNNIYHDNLGDNSDYGPNLTNVLIQGNTYYSPDPANVYSIHLDNIQVWTTNATQDTVGMVIKGNYIYADNPDGDAQTIFIRGDFLNSADGLTNEYRIKDVTIENNVVNGTQSHGISAAGVDGLLIQNNTLHYAGTTTNPNAANLPGIDTNLDTDVLIINNIMPNKYGYPATDTDTFKGNILYNLGDDSTSQLFVNPNAADPTMEDFASLNVAALQNTDGSIKGALTVTADANHPTAIVTQDYAIVNGEFQYTFDASQSLAKVGSDLTGATYTWTFADGTIMHGLTVSKDFAQAGMQDVELTVTDSNGHSDTLDKIVPIRDEVALNMNFDNNVYDFSSTASNITSISAPVYVDSPYGGKALSLAANNDHIYVDVKNDVDLSHMTELTVAFSMQAAKADNGSMILADSPGSWGLYLNAYYNTFQLTIAGVSKIFVAPANLLDDQWHDIAISVSQNTLTIYTDGKAVYNTALTQTQANSFFSTSNPYGIDIGGNGPWTINPNIQGPFEGNIDNLYIGTTALTAQQIADMHVANTTVSAHTLTAPDIAPFNLVDTDDANNTVTVGAAIGTTVGITGHATDLDLGDQLTYSLLVDAMGMYTIDPHTGVVTTAEVITSPIAERITIKATDQSGLSVFSTFNVSSIAAPNSAPVNLIDNNNTNNSVAENAAIGTNVGITAHATDYDTGDTLTYSLSDNAGGKFAIDATTGVVTTADSLDYNVSQSHSITVFATDKGGLTASQSFTIAVTANPTPGITVNGTSGNDILTGGAGNDTLFGNGGNDVFVFNRNSGNDTIRDFASGSKINITSASSMSDLTITAHGSDTYIAIHGTTDHITLTGVAPDHIAQSDFIFA